MKSIWTSLSAFLTGYKTMIAAAIVFILSQMQAWDWATILTNPKSFAWTTSIMAIWFGLLRLMTNTTAFKKTSPAPMPLGFNADGTKI
jgi:hypothetical protein